MRRRISHHCTQRNTMGDKNCDVAFLTIAHSATLWAIRTANSHFSPLRTALRELAPSPLHTALRELAPWQVLVGREPFTLHAAKRLWALRPSNWLSASILVRLIREWLLHILRSISKTFKSIQRRRVSSIQL